MFCGVRQTLYVEGSLANFEIIMHQQRRLRLVTFKISSTDAILDLKHGSSIILPSNWSVTGQFYPTYNLVGLVEFEL